MLLQDLLSYYNSPNIPNKDKILNKASIDLFHQKNRIDEKSCMELNVEMPTFVKKKMELARKVPEKISNQNWFISPLHNSVKNDSYILYSVLSLLGASFEAKNKEGKSVLEELFEVLDNDSKNFNNSNAFVKWWILKVTDQHWLKLFKAASEKWSNNCLNILIENKSDVSAWNYKDGNTALHFASLSSHEIIQKLFSKPFASHSSQDIVQKLISKNADVNAKNFHGETPLYYCASRQNLNIMQLLIKENADVNAKNSNGDAPIHAAAEVGTIECLKCLVENGANVNEENNSKARPLHFIGNKMNFSSEVEECIKFLIEKGAEINSNDKENNTPLHDAAKSFIADEAKEKCCKFLINSGANLSAKNDDGDTPLHLAANDHSIATLQYLLEAGAKVIVNEENNDKQTPLHCYVESTHSNLSEEKIKKIFEILMESGADLSIKDRDGNTPLHLAAQSCNIVTLKCLLEHGANVNEKNNDKQTSLHCVFTSHHFLRFSQDIVECIIILKDSGAEINAKDKDDNTPLHLAIKSDFSDEKKEKSCEFLIESRADLSAKDCRRKTPLDHKFLKKLKRKNPGLFKITLPEIC